MTVLASVGHTVKNQTPRNGAAVWVEAVKASEFTVCVLEFGNGSNRTLEVNWLSFQASLRGSQIGSASLNSWTTGTQCKRIDFQQVSIAMSICSQVAPSLPGCTVSSLPCSITTLLSRCLVASLPRCLVASLPRCLVASLPRCLVASLPRCLVASLPR